jgi:signal transduction histidine kinase/DNA-binding response OmpR family regulator
MAGCLNCKTGLLLRALTRICALVAEGLPEQRLVAQLARATAQATGSDLAAVYLQTDQPNVWPAWRLAGHWGGDDEVLLKLPTMLGTGGGVLAPLFQASREVYEPDLLDDPDENAAVPHRMPGRSLAGLPVRHRDSRVIGALILGSNEKDAFDWIALATLRCVAQLLGVGIDNARMALSQQRLRRLAIESQATLGTVLESVDSGICVVEPDGSLRIANKAWQDMFGIKELTVGLTQEDAFAFATIRPREAEAFTAHVRELIAEPDQVDESEWELATDPPRIIKRYSSPMRNQVGEIIGRVAVHTDITESRHLYTQLLNSERLRAIGEMASGVAHDFNNLLASILGQVELLHPDELPPAAQQAIAAIRQSAMDGARMVRNLQGLARPRVDTPSTAADLNETVQVALEMARPRWASAALRGHSAIDVAVTLAAAGSLSQVAIDPAELREVLLNLLFNAYDAMPQGGRIEVETRPGQQPKTADLIVRDTGHGMPEAVRARIFEPFFSTKGPKGTGLGLAVTYSIITRCGGQIAVESVVDQGTTFTLTLPYVPTELREAQQEPFGVDTVAQAASRRRPPDGPEPSATARADNIRGTRILVADDEPGLVAVVRQLMQRSGAEVSSANGGSEAVEMLRAPGPRFHVVITDLDMPEVDGWAVAAAAKSHSPDTRVVMLTGFAGDLSPDDYHPRGVDVMLAKPSSRDDLESTIGELLSPKAEAGFEVLLVEDEPVFARAVRDMLTLQRHRVTVVDSAAAAIERIAAHPFDVVLTDYSLGGVSGAELAEQLADRGTKAYVILITGYAIEINDPSLLSRGVNAVLPKPCRTDDLRQVLARVPRSD